MSADPGALTFHNLIGKSLGSQVGLSENVGLIFPMIASHLKTGFHDQQNHWVRFGVHNIFSNTPI